MKMKVPATCRAARAVRGWVLVASACALCWSASVGAQEAQVVRPAADPQAEPLSELDDSDGDRVANAQDMCPGTTRGWKTDHNGCPIAQAPAAVAEHVPAKVTFDSAIMFESASARVTSHGATLLAQAAVPLKAPPPAGQRWDIKVVGHADVMGNVSRNVVLSQARAQAVRAQFINAGVAAASMSAIGRGSQEPIVDCPETMPRQERVACLAPNRRVEVEVNLVPATP